MLLVTLLDAAVLTYIADDIRSLSISVTGGIV